MVRRWQLYDTHFQAADLLFGAGRHWQSRMIGLCTTTWAQLFRRQLISHCAIVAPFETGPMLYESTSLNDHPCEVTGKRVRGVQAHEPERWVQEYDGAVWRLRLSKRDRLSGQRAARLGGFCLSMLGTPYDYTQAVIAGTHWVKRSSFLRPDKSFLFCDEFASFALFDAGIARGEFNPSAIAPAWLAWHLVERAWYPPLEQLK